MSVSRELFAVIRRITDTELLRCESLIADEKLRRDNGRYNTKGEENERNIN
jgi:hypothetical protein